MVVQVERGRECILHRRREVRRPVHFVHVRDFAEVQVLQLEALLGRENRRDSLHRSFPTFADSQRRQGRVADRLAGPLDKVARREVILSTWWQRTFGGRKNVL